MNEKAFDELWKRIFPWFHIGDRWILLIPFVSIPFLFWILSRLYPSHSFVETLTGKYFIVGFAIIILATFFWFSLETRLPPRKDRWVLLIPLFASVSDNNEERSEGNRLRSKIIKDLDELREKNRTSLRPRKVNVVINPEDENWVKRAKIWGKHMRANAVLCANVVYDTQLKAHDYCFSPFIVSMTTYRIDEKIVRRLNPLELPPEALVSDLRGAMSVKSKEITDTVVLLAALPFFSQGEYQKFIDATNLINVTSADLLQYRAKALLMTGKIEEAISVAVEAIQQEPSNPESWFAIGLGFMALKHWSEAKNVMLKVSELNPRHLGASLLRLMATLKETEDHLKEAKEAVDHADNLHRETQHWLESDNLCNHGELLLQTRDFSGALRAFEGALSLDDSDERAWGGQIETLLGLGDFQLDQENFAEALKTFEKAQSTSKGSKYEAYKYKASFGKAEALLCLQRRDEAIKEIENAQNPSMAIILFRRKMAEEGEDAARAMLSDHRKLSPSERWARLKASLERSERATTPVTECAPQNTAS